MTRFNESNGLERSALFELGVILFVISLAVNIGARYLLHRQSVRRPRVRRRHHPLAPLSSRGEGPLGPGAPPAWWADVTARQRSRRRARRVTQWVVIALALAAVAVAVFPLASLVTTTASQGGSALVRPSFYTASPPPDCGLNNTSCPLGGVGPEIEGTLVLLGLSGAIGIPVGLLAGIYLSEYGRRRMGAGIGVVIDSLLGMPSILIGLFVFALFLDFDRFDAQSTIAASAALALLMVPIVAKATETSLRLVPNSVREGALALGFPRHRVTLRVVLGSARNALVTGTLLAVMRAGGEAAAVVLAGGTSIFWLQSLHTPVPALAPFIYYALSTNAGSANYAADAAGAALVLLLIIAVVSLAARLTVGGAEDGSAD